MMKKNEPVAEFIGDVHVLQHAKDALLVSALGVISAVFQIAVARLARTSQEMPNLESHIIFLTYNIHHFSSYGLFVLREIILLPNDSIPSLS